MIVRLFFTDLTAFYEFIDQCMIFSQLGDAPLPEQISAAVPNMSDNTFPAIHKNRYNGGPHIVIFYTFRSCPEYHFIGMQDSLPECLTAKLGRGCPRQRLQIGYNRLNSKPAGCISGLMSPHSICNNP
ncbi:hypothetical protein D3C85_1495620 [compost metagenome]